MQHVFREALTKRFLPSWWKVILNRSDIIASCCPVKCERSYKIFPFSVSAIKFKFCRFSRYPCLSSRVRQIWKGCDGFWRNLRLVLGSEICLTPPTRWLRSPTKGPHNLTQEIAVKEIYFFNKLIVLPKTSRFIFYTYFISFREYVKGLGSVAKP